MTTPITTLLTGANTTLTKEKWLEVAVSWVSAPAGLDLSCFMVGSNGKVPSDAYFIFYNQPVDPHGLVKFKSAEAKAAFFLIDLEGLLTTEIDKCVFAATLDYSGTFSNVNGCKVMGRTSQADVVYEIHATGDETSLVFMELYRHQGWWKLRAIGKGFNGGLQPLAEAHGVSIADEEDEALVQTSANVSDSATEPTTSAPSLASEITALSGQMSVPGSALTLTPASREAALQATVPIHTPARASSEGSMPVSVFAAQAVSTSVFASQFMSVSVFATGGATTSVFHTQPSQRSWFASQTR